MKIEQPEKDWQPLEQSDPIYGDPRMLALAQKAKVEVDKDLWVNDLYQVARRDMGGAVHLSIKRLDREPVRDWRHFQWIKNQLVGPECEAIEIYPAESRMVDSANQYHLWCSTDPKFRFPCGFDGERIVMEDQSNNTKQRPWPNNMRPKDLITMEAFEKKVMNDADKNTNPAADILRTET